MFDTHMLNDNGKTEVTAFKTEFSKAVKEALVKLPDGREKAIFLTKLEEAVFFGTKAIAGKQGNFSSITEY